MSMGLLALLDDVAALVKASMAGLDDIPMHVAKTGTKVSGVVIDDTAVTPKYVVGLDASRELAIIYQIAKKSLFNKVVILTPAAMVLNWIAPWLLTPVLMLGGGYLCFEGYEKVHELVHGWVHQRAHEPAHIPQVDGSLAHPAHTQIPLDTPHTPDTAEILQPLDGDVSERLPVVQAITPEELEAIRVDSAVRTDMILSAEIVAIAYATVVQTDFLTQVIVMLSVALLITVGVYGAVALIVKADDAGLYLAKRGPGPMVQSLGRNLIYMMPHVLTGLSYLGTVAMLWVGAEITTHGIEPVHHTLQHGFDHLTGIGWLDWIIAVLILAVIGLAIGAVIEQLLRLVQTIRHRVQPPPVGMEVSALGNKTE